MSAIDLHPEELLELDALGELSPEEAERLELHLQRCEVCRFERRARAAFLSEAEGPAHRFDPGLLRSLPIPASPLPEPRATGRPSRRRRAGVVTAAFCIAAATSAAAAAGLAWVRSAPDSAAPPATVAKGTTSLPRRLPSSLPPSTPPAVPPIPANPPPAENVVQVRPPESVPSGAPMRSAEVPPDAAALFSRANEARRDGARPQALRLYRALLRRFPASPEAHHAQAVVGRLLLDDGDAQASLPYFDDYLRRGGLLTEDVLFERAVALQRLQRTRDEIAAWRTLLAVRPASVHAARAKARLVELGER